MSVGFRNTVSLLDGGRVRDQRMITTCINLRLRLVDSKGNRLLSGYQRPPQSKVEHDGYVTSVASAVAAEGRNPREFPTGGSLHSGLHDKKPMLVPQKSLPKREDLTARRQFLGRHRDTLVIGAR